MFCLYTLLSLLILIGTYSSIKPSKFVQYLGFNEVDVNLNFGSVAAFGDFNNDKMNDLFLFNQDQTSVFVHIWNHKNFEFQLLPKTEINYTLNNIKLKIVNVIPGDFNYDGKLDVLIYCQKFQSASTNLFGMEQIDNVNPDKTFMRIFYGNSVDAFEQSTYKDLENSTLSQPLLFDFYGIMKPSLLGYSDLTKNLSLWNVFEAKNNSFQGITFNGTKPLCKFSHPNSNAFIDLDGDCLADLFFTCQDSENSQQYMQIWLNRKEDGFVFSKELQLPKGAGRISFSDMDGDGTMDIVFPTCVDNICQINVAYNKQIPICSINIHSNCRKKENLCISDENFEFNFDLNSELYSVFSLPNQDTESLVIEDELFFDKNTIPLRIGDFNLDGFPDLIIITKLNSNPKKQKLNLLTSIPCNSDICNEKEIRNFRRKFELLTVGADKLNNYFGEFQEALFQGAFFDLDEDGSLDLIIFYKNLKNNSFGLKFFINNFFNDAFFLKSLVLNGVCPSWCPDGERVPNTKPYGVNYVGSTLKFQVAGTSGETRARIISQLPQTSYHSLQTPYNLFGLGRTNNYIENLFIGVSRHQVCWPKR
ncbi:hypothetical protein HK099_006748 [Clydaea vesicula]|uniref:T-cell immunomodulatory protein TIP C2 domain-containing protein n=1 Tax=Clydaea vesicula TaxID=447962 RepID=A0AAD5U7N1_9FUNG|nr:hypothetical protein HK099_006748 [Clydaea vesicula]